MRTLTSWSAPAAVVAAVLVCASQSDTLLAHGTEARRVVVLPWPKPHITRVLGANRSELGLNGSKAPEQPVTIAGRSCLFGDLVAFDVDDGYAFDIDEAVDVTVTYAPDRTQPFTIAWDRNGGDGFGMSPPVPPEPGAPLRTATAHLERARFAGLGILNTDLAVATSARPSSAQAQLENLGLVAIAGLALAIARGRRTRCGPR